MSYNKLLFWLKSLKNCKNVNCNNFTVSLPGEQNDLSTKLVQNDCALLHQYPFVLSHMVCFSLSDILALFRNILCYFCDIQSSQPKTFHHETWVKNKNQNCEVYFLIIWMISWICVTCNSAPIFLKDQQIYFSVIKKIAVWVIFPSLLSPICGGGLCSGPFGWISLPYFSFFYDLSPLSWVQFVVVCEPREKLDFKLCHSRLLSISGAQPFLTNFFTKVFLRKNLQTLDPSSNSSSCFILLAAVTLWWENNAWKEGLGRKGTQTASNVAPS